MPDVLGLVLERRDERRDDTFVGQHSEGEHRGHADRLVGVVDRVVQRRHGLAELQPSELDRRAPTDLRGLLHGGVPQVSFADVEKDLAAVRRMAALNQRLALVEMTKHEFLDAGYRKERTTFADGTTVTVDWDTQSVTVAP